MESTRELPPFPKSWFYVGPAKSIAQKPMPFNIGGVEFVAFRDDENELVALQRRCSHMNADLSLGCVKNNRLQCLLHQYSFDKEGHCETLQSAKIRSYPVKERNGFVFFFNDPIASFDLPFFLGENPDHFDSSSVQVISTENEWFVGAANAFDVVHFETVHLRHLLKNPALSRPAAQAYRIELDYEIRGRSLSDQLMKTFYGKKAGLDFTVFGGNFILAVTTVKELKNYMMIINGPNGLGRSVAHLMVYSKKTSNPLKILKRNIQAIFSRKFFQDEANSSRGVFIDNKTLGPHDHVMADYLKWLMGLYRN
ncbi:MAG: Rieske 2Fe-2S domain-containing protein [Bacteriovorax sp.]